jgi:3-deoxy-manno-octulosonate cytidylyltransferase (CMP-KDO synthetase)
MKMETKRPRIAIIIPARLESQRLPGKALLEFSGLPMVEHVRRRGILNSFNCPVIVATGDEEIVNVVSKFSAKYYLTVGKHENGTSRVHEVSKSLDFTHYIVLQGDELLVLPEQIDLLISAIEENPELDFFNLTANVKGRDEVSDESVVKCLLNTHDEILYMFRKSPLIGDEELTAKLLRKVLGIFAISKSGLEQLDNYTPTILERSQSIEQLRFIERGGKIKSVTTTQSHPSVNVPADIEHVNAILSTSEVQKRILAQITSEK